MHGNHPLRKIFKNADMPACILESFIHAFLWNRFGLHRGRVPLKFQKGPLRAISHSGMTAASAGDVVQWYGAKNTLP